MQRRWLGLPKLVAMIGGFLILAGTVLLGLAALALAGYLNVSILLERKYVLTFAIAMVLIGLLDTFSAIVIARW